MITLNSVTKKYKNSDEEIALNNVSLSFEDGLIHGIIGVSGAGKSTLIRLLNKLEPYDSGLIDVLSYSDIRNINKESTRMLQKKIGMVFQSDHLLSRKTVIENILFPISLHRKISSKDIEYANSLIEETGLNGYENRYPSQLSGGQRQRVGIARALINNPELLLCDEPTSALDVITTGNILKLIKNISKSHEIGVIIVTHDMNVIKKICDTVTVMEKGYVVERGTVDELLFRPKHDQSKAFIKEVGFDLSSIVTDEKVKLLLLSFPKGIVHEGIISNMTKECDSSTSIIYANINPNNNGIMLLEVKSDLNKIKSYLEDKKVVVTHVV